MNIHEYQAKELLAKYGVPVPAGYAAMSVEEAVEGAKKLPGPLWVVKAQIHAGGRGKGRFKELGPDGKGGVRLAHSVDEVRENAAEMLGKTLVTVQTGPHGKQVQRLYITDGVDIDKEFYLALLVDRESGRIALVASTEGGVEIEKVAHETPEKITTLTIDPATGLMPHHGREVAAALGLSGDLAKQAGKVLATLYEAFVGTDASQIEINPLAVTAAFKIILSDPAVKGILVNIFGGIMRCDIIAEGIVAAAREVHLEDPLVVRLEGTNVQQGKDILAASGLAIIPADDLGDAARK